VPACSTARRALAHGLKLCGDLLQCAIRRCRLDAGDQPDQPVIALLAWRAVQQCRLAAAIRTHIASTTQYAHSRNSRSAVNSIFAGFTRILAAIDT
jgi:hypothetical protein